VTEPTSTTLPGDPGATTTTGPTTTTVPGDDPAVQGDAPSETVPQVDITVPPRDPSTSTGSAAGPAPIAGRVVKVDLRAARAAALERQALLDAATARRGELEAHLAGLHAAVDRLETAQREAVNALADARRDLSVRAANAYMRGPVDIASVEHEGGDPNVSGSRALLLTAVLEADHAAVVRVRETKSRVTAEQAKTAADLTSTETLLFQAKVDEDAAREAVESSKLELAVTSNGGTLVIHGFVFPVAPPYLFREDFGDPRMPGTDQAHFHMGCDVAAAEGTELYAAERGVITSMLGGGLGGTGLFLKGESGTSYYYAHLSAYAPDLHPGQVVEAGELVGFVGHTGDAYGPHLHFEVHPGGGEAIDPYPILKASDDLAKESPG
jgi:murein DD-endopeptidase MepM/ murein hydrolase activator NlpD